MTDNSLEQNPEQSRTLSVNDDHQIHDETRPPGSEDCPKLTNCTTALGQLALGPKPWRGRIPKCNHLNLYIYAQTKTLKAP